MPEEPTPPEIEEREATGGRTGHGADTVSQGERLVGHITPVPWATPSWSKAMERRIGVRPILVVQADKTQSVVS